MESRQSGRADGRGWGGRGDSGPRRGAPSGDEPPGEPEPSPRGPPPPPTGVEDLRDLLRSAGESGGAPPPPDDDPTRGPGATPWVRSGEPRARADDRAGAPRGTPPLPDLSALLVALEGMRGMVPRELTSQVNALVRELLLTLRALIDWYLARLEPRPGGPEVEEIPID